MNFHRDTDNGIPFPANKEETSILDTGAVAVLFMNGSIEDGDHVEGELSPV